MNRQGKFLIFAVAVSMLMLAAGVYLLKEKEAEGEAVWMDITAGWQDGPVGVRWDREVFADYNDTINDAMQMLNRRVGCQMLIVDETPGAGITITSYDGDSCSDATDSKAPMWACIRSGHVDIQVKQLDSTGLAFRQILHELGHALGLAHDADGMMASAAMEPKPGDYPEFRLLSPKDEAALRDRYCR
ncbi:MAG: hypothetical protein M3Q00_00625 [Pseudomonadota bacterium]|nr:hypothetical protein [Pseudomonadota bacterium]